MTVRLVVVGDALLDRDVVGQVRRLAPDAPAPVVEEAREHARPGGAALAATFAARSGAQVVLITALADDRAGRELKSLITAEGISVVDCGAVGPTAEKIRIGSPRGPLVRWDRGGSRDVIGLPGAAWPDADLDAAFRGADAILVSDYGRGMTAAPIIRRRLAAARAPLVWDPHPRGAPALSKTSLVCPSAQELAQLPLGPEAGTPRRPRVGEGADAAMPPAERDPLGGLVEQAQALLTHWDARNVVVTRGDRGAVLLSDDGGVLVVPVQPVQGQDACGAGDHFAVCAALALARGALPSEAVMTAVAGAASFVRDGGVAALREAGRTRAAASTSSGSRGVPAGGDAFEVAAHVHAAGGTVVATGGCFDLLHAGHVRLLSDARSLGDCLIVCLNSDESVRRLKGPGRPLVSQEDRAAVLLGLGSVDAVVVFDEDTPAAALQGLRPHVFVKGADYTVERLPEASVVARWGGQAVVLPYLAGRSTSRLVAEVVRREQQQQ